MATGVFFDAIGAERRIDGNWNGAREENSCVRNEKRAGSGKHERDASAGWNTKTREFRGAALSGGVEFGKSEREFFFAGFGVFCDVEMDAGCVMERAAAENVVNCFRGEDALFRGCELQFLVLNRGAKRGRRLFNR